MGYDDRREVFERLEALERLASRHERHGGWDDDRHGGRDRGHRHACCHEHHHDRSADGDFDEKRIIDTIVRLVCENVGRMMRDQEAQSRGHDDGSGEKRIVDLIVGLVSEHVREIVATELDRRLGRPELRPGDAPAAAPAPPRGGAPDPEQS